MSKVSKKKISLDIQEDMADDFEPGLHRRHLNFRKVGATVDGDECPECGGLTDFQNGYLTCCECGWTEDVIELFEMERFTA